MIKELVRKIKNIYSGCDCWIQVIFGWVSCFKGIGYFFSRLI